MALVDWSKDERNQSMRYSVSGCLPAVASKAACSFSHPGPFLDDLLSKDSGRIQMTIDQSAPISLSAGLAIALLAGASGVASAKDVKVIAPPSDALTELVSYADLNLASAPGATRLTFRVRGAVRRVCEPLHDRRLLADHAACTSYAWNGARPQMDRAITRAHQIASNGTSSIAPVAIVISAPAR